MIHTVGLLYPIMASMDFVPDAISELLHRSKKLREGAVRLLSEAEELATKAEELIKSGKETGRDWK